MNVLDLAMTHGLQPKKASAGKGGEYSSPCPFCGGNDRFRIWPEQNSGNGSYWCRQCLMHGDRIQFVIDTQKVGFKAACRITGDDAIADEFKSDSSAPYSRRVSGAPRIPIASSNKTAFVPKGNEVPAGLSYPEVWMEKAWKLVMWAAEKLPGSDGERVLAEKNISMETARRYYLGWIPEDVYRPRESWGLSTIIKADTQKPKKLWIPKGLVIPGISYKSGINGLNMPESDDNPPENMGKIIRIRIRRPEGEPRYSNVPGSDMRQMILGAAGRCVVVLESELDAILLNHVAGDITSVIALGTAHAKPDEAATRLLNSALCILVATDFDEAGKSAFAWWKQTFPRSVRWPSPRGKDVSDALCRDINLRTWVIAGWPAGWRLTQNKTVSDMKSIAVSGDEKTNLVISESKKPQAVESPAEEFTGPLDELKKLMRKNPKIKIVINNHQMALNAPDDWRRRNASIFQRISRLVYFEPVIFEHLHRHPAKIINYENITA